MHLFLFFLSLEFKQTIIKLGNENRYKRNPAMGLTGSYFASCSFGLFLAESSSLFFPHFGILTKNEK